MKFINLVLFSKSPPEQNHYENMKSILERYYSIYNNVKTIFYLCDPSIDTDFILDRNILYIKEEDTFIPGILKKTIKAFEYIAGNLNIFDFDYIIRSNVSTLVNFKLLEDELKNNPINVYGGGKINNLQWLGGGIEDNTWFGTLFISGTSIILTKEGLKFILVNKDKIRYDIIDDVAIGILFREYLPNFFPKSLDSKYIEVPYLSQNNSINIEKLKEIISYNHIFYRNNCLWHKYRHVDVYQMEVLANILLNNNKKFYI